MIEKTSRQHAFAHNSGQLGKKGMAIPLSLQSDQSQRAVSEAPKSGAKRNYTLVMFAKKTLPARIRTQRWEKKTLPSLSPLSLKSDQPQRAVSEASKSEAKRMNYTMAIRRSHCLYYIRSFFLGLLFLFFEFHLFSECPSKLSFHCVKK